MEKHNKDACLHGSALTTQMSLEQLGNLGVKMCRVFAQSVQQNAEELVDIVLLKHLRLAPAKRGKKLLSVDGLVGREHQPSEQFLKLGDDDGILVVRCLENKIDKVLVMEETLNQRVQVARRAVVAQTSKRSTPLDGNTLLCITHQGLVRDVILKVVLTKHTGKFFIDLHKHEISSSTV